MSLSKATNIALVGLALALIISLTQWVLATFAREVIYGVNYEIRWISTLFWLISTLLNFIPLIIFLKVLSNKQKGGSNV